MFFYKAVCTLKENEHSEEKQKRKASDIPASEVREKTERFNEEQMLERYCFFSSESSETAVIGILSQKKSDCNDIVFSFGSSINLDIAGCRLEEITFKEYTRLLSGASSNEYIEKVSSVIERFGLEILEGRGVYRLDLREKLVGDTENTDLDKRASLCSLSDALLEELSRIRKGSAVPSAFGHPVHYLLETDDRNEKEKAVDVLIGALFKSGRIESGRYLIVDPDSLRGDPDEVFRPLFQSAEGGTIVFLDSGDKDDSENDSRVGENENRRELCKLIRAYRHRVLTVICFPSECEKAKAEYFSHLGSIPIIDLKEMTKSGAEAEKYLRMLADNRGIQADASLTGPVQGNDSFTPSMLDEQFETWFAKKLKEEIYPQYRQVNNTSVRTLSTSRKEDAYNELNALIGVQAAKETVRKAIDYFRVQKLLNDRGIRQSRPSMNMVFTGNPGTAKTTVARLFARIMRDNGLLTTGNFIETGRGDLVGKYVGWTAKSVRDRFREANGGVLFIDEAYSLLDDRTGSFGDEAINTIVQEMENHREDVVVIFAGYPEPMEAFLRRNPGLSSRVAFHVSFSDYSAEELCGIAERKAEQEGLVLSPGAIIKMKTGFEAIRCQSDFGNGRFVRNLVEQAAMNLASRVLRESPDDLSTERLTTVLAEDIVFPEKTMPEKRCVGF